MGVWITLGIIVAAAALVIILYNRLVRMRQMAEEGWSGIDVQLKRRADLVPNLVETVKGYASHERETFDEVTRLRTEAGNVPEGDVAGRARAEGLLGQALGRLLAVAENYPELRASENFAELQKALEGTENEISMARRYYNGAVRNLNVAVEQFPSNLIATYFKFEKREYFEVEDAGDRALPRVVFGDR